MATSPRDQRRRYETDLTDEQWGLVEPLLPPPSKDGPKPKHPRREVVNAILYVVRTGCAWRHLPTDFPPWGTVFWWFQRWSRDGVATRVHDRLRDAVRDAEGRDPMASAGIVDAQPGKGADTVAGAPRGQEGRHRRPHTAGAATRGYDAGKRVNGRKRHIVVDTLGLLIVVMVTAAA